MRSRSAIGDCLQPGATGGQAAIRLSLGRDPSELDADDTAFAETLLRIEELSALLLQYRVRQLSLPAGSEDWSRLTPERPGIARDSPWYHPARRALAPVTVVTSIEGTATRHALLNGTDERYSAGQWIDPNRPIYEGRFGYGVRDTRGRELWSTLPSGQRCRIVNDVAPHAAGPWSCRAYEAAPSLKFLREQGLERCIPFSLLFDEQGRLIAQHRKLLCRFHELDIETDPSIRIDLKNGILTLRSDVFVWGVFRRSDNAEALADNTFNLLPGISYSVP